MDTDLVVGDVVRLRNIRVIHRRLNGEAVAELSYRAAKGHDYIVVLLDVVPHDGRVDPDQLLGKLGYYLDEAKLLKQLAREPVVDSEPRPLHQ